MATHSYNTGLSYDLGNGTFSDIGEVINIDEAALKASATKTTHLKSTGAHHTYIPGLVDPGQLKLEVNYVKAQTTVLKALLVARANQAWKVTLPDGSTWSNDGFLMEMGRGKIAEDDRITNTLTLQLSGPATWTPAA